MTNDCVDEELYAIRLAEMADLLFERWCREQKVKPIDALTGGPLLVLEAERRSPPPTAGGTAGKTRTEAR